MKQEYRKVRIEDFDEAELRRLCKNGRLFVKKGGEQTSMERKQTRSDIMKYVSRTDECASETFSSRIHGIWRGIVYNERLYPTLLYKKGKKSGEMNPLRIMAIVDFLKEEGVYRQELRQTEMINRIEGASGNKYICKGLSSYCPNPEEIRIIRGIIAESQ